MKKTLAVLMTTMGIFSLGLFTAFAADQGKSVENSRSLFRIVIHTKGLYVRIPVESVDRSGRVRIPSRKVRVTEEALYFDKKGVLESVAYYQKTGGRELLLKGPNEYMGGGLLPMVVLGYFPYSSSIPEGLSFFTNTLQVSPDPLRISDVFPPLFDKSGVRISK